MKKVVSKNISKISNNNDCAMLIARIFLAAIFAVSAFGKITGFSGQSAFAESSWLSFGVIPGELLIVIAIIMEVFGVVALVTGWKMREGAYVLALYTFLTIIMFHIGPGQLMAALKNFAIIGGLFALSLNKSGKYSL